MKLSSSVRNSLLLVLAALIWGISFSAQSAGLRHFGPYSLNALRLLLGGVTLLPVCLLFDTFKNAEQRAAERRSRPRLLVGGLCCGVIVGLATQLQQISLQTNAAGKVGFITACYIVWVPVLGIVLRRHCSILVWLGVALAVVALYFLCAAQGQSLAITKNDTLAIACSIVFALHILAVDRFAPNVDGVRLSCVQFLVAGLVCLVPMLFKEGFPMASAFKAGMVPLLFLGIMSCGIAYTLQILGQRDVNPTIASLLMSLESVFSVLGGFVLLGQRLSGREILGCVLMFVAIILAQVPWPRTKKTT